MTRTVVGAAPDGSPVEHLVLGPTRADGPRLHLLTLGAAVHRLEVVGGDGERRDMALGHDSVEQRLAAKEYQGAVVGRYANRIAHGDLPLPGGTVRLPTNDRGHHLHGGPDGWHLRAWSVEEQTTSRARLRLDSPDGDQGYPGRVELTATYDVDDHAVSLVLEGTTDAPTVLNPSHHLYLNLAGLGRVTVDDHHLRVPADAWTPVDDTAVPLGEHADVTDTPFDLRGGPRLGEVLRADHPQLRATAGIDHNFVLSGDLDDSGLRTAAVLTCPGTRTAMTLRTDRPGLQVYTGNGLDGTALGHGGRMHRQGDGLALEPQLFPDSPHHPDWPSALLRPGERFHSRMTWRFDATV